jgi:exodeoxyribonuclease VII large subunit
MQKIFCVSEINKYINRLILKDFALSNISIKGEISNLTYHYSGHLYFTIKDEKSKIKAVMFRNEAQFLNFSLENGMKVILKGRIGVYERDGVYQIYVNEIDLDGIGSLYIAFEKLKKKLENEGLFDNSYKKNIPFLPKNICVITSKTGAVIEDIINVTKRRFENVNILLLPVTVQGRNAKTTIVSAIECANKYNLGDVIILARGGGSLEELWAFNEEIVARSIFDSTIPVISAVGHETDFTISDFVADVRAPTPSAAAEIVVPVKDVLVKSLIRMDLSLKNSLKRILAIKRLKLERLQKYGLDKYSKNIINNEKMKLDGLNSRYIICIKNIFNNKKMNYLNLFGKFEVLSPYKIMKKGYSIIEKEKSKIVIKDEDQVKENENIIINLSKGKLYCKVLKKEK